MNDFALPRALLFATGALTLVAAGAGLLAPQLYAPVVPPEILPGVFAQDLFAAVGALLLLGLAFRLRRGAVRPVIKALGALGFLCYAYGIYAIEQVYTPLYPLYLAVLSSAFFTLAHLVATLERYLPTRLRLPAGLRRAAAGFGAFVAVAFTALWLGQLAPLLRTGERIEYTFSVYVIDLAFVMPAFAVAALLALRRHPLGLVGLPALFLVGVGILAPLALAELLEPVRYDLPFDAGVFGLFGGLSLAFGVLATATLASLAPDAGDGARAPAGGVRRYD